MPPPSESGIVPVFIPTTQPCISMRSFLLLGLAATTALTLAACDSTTDDGSGDIVANRVTELPADPNTGLGPDGRPTGATGRYTFYSLRENKVVPNTDSASTKWDVAFRSSTILANQTAGSKGGILLRVGAFADLAEAPDTTYGASVSGAQWYDYANNIITPKAGRVLVVKTADGKYAKMRLVSYYKGQTASNDPTASRYFTFDYALNTDGDRRFD